MGPLIFLLYINDLHNVIKFSQTLCFVDDAYLLDIQSKISKNNKSLNKDLKELSFWLNANKIALNVAKTEIILSHFVSSEILRSVYFAMFQSHINYVFVALGLTSYPKLKVFFLQTKALRRINFYHLMHILHLYLKYVKFGSLLVS